MLFSFCDVFSPPKNTTLKWRGVTTSMGEKSSIGVLTCGVTNTMAVSWHGKMEPHSIGIGLFRYGWVHAWCLNMTLIFVTSANIKLFSYKPQPREYSGNCYKIGDIFYSRVIVLNSICSFLCLHLILDFFKYINIQM